MGRRALGKAPDARSELGRAKDELVQAGGRFPEPRYWLTRYVWVETTATAARYRRVRGPLSGPATAIVHAREAGEVAAKLLAQLSEIGLDLVEVVFTEPWADAGTLLVR